MKLTLAAFGNQSQNLCCHGQPPTRHYNEAASQRAAGTIRYHHCKNLLKKPAATPQHCLDTLHLEAPPSFSGDRSSGIQRACAANAFVPAWPQGSCTSAVLHARSAQSSNRVHQTTSSHVHGWIKPPDPGQRHTSQFHGEQQKAKEGKR